MLGVVNQVLLLGVRQLGGGGDEKGGCWLAAEQPNVEMASP